MGWVVQQGARCQLRTEIIQRATRVEASLRLLRHGGSIPPGSIFLHSRIALRAVVPTHASVSASPLTPPRNIAITRLMSSTLAHAVDVPRGVTGDESPECRVVPSVAQEEGAQLPAVQRAGEADGHAACAVVGFDTPEHAGDDLGDGSLLRCP
jgi:hypothetical protein